MGKATVLLYIVPEHESTRDLFTSWQIVCYVVRGRVGGRGNHRIMQARAKHSRALTSAANEQMRRWAGNAGLDFDSGVG